MLFLLCNVFYTTKTCFPQIFQNPKFANKTWGAKRRQGGKNNNALSLRFYSLNQIRRLVHLIKRKFVSPITT